MNNSDAISSSPSVQLRARIANRSAIIAVIGLGAEGTPVLGRLGLAGFRTFGVDINIKRCQYLQDLLNPNSEPSFVKSAVRTAENQSIVSSRTNLSVHHSIDDIDEVDIVYTCVNIPMAANWEEPDLDILFKVVLDCKRLLRPGTLLIVNGLAYWSKADARLAQMLDAVGVDPHELLVAYAPKNLLPHEHLLFSPFDVRKVAQGSEIVLSVAIPLLKLLYETVDLDVVPSRFGSGDIIRFIKGKELPTIFKELSDQLQIAGERESAARAELDRAVREARSAGFTWRAIANTLGISHTTAHTRWSEAGRTYNRERAARMRLAAARSGQIVTQSATDLELPMTPNSPANKIQEGVEPYDSTQHKAPDQGNDPDSVASGSYIEQSSTPEAE